MGPPRSPWGGKEHVPRAGADLGPNPAVGLSPGPGGAERWPLALRLWAGQVPCLLASNWPEMRQNLGPCPAAEPLLLWGCMEHLQGIVRAWLVSRLHNQIIREFPFRQFPGHAEAVRALYLGVILFLESTLGSVKISLTCQLQPLLFKSI